MLATCPGATLKKILFPVQRVADIVASRAAAKFFFSFFFSLRNLCEFLKKSIFSFFSKKLSSQQELSHPVGLRETDFFL